MLAAVKAPLGSLNKLNKSPPSRLYRRVAVQRCVTCRAAAHDDNNCESPSAPAVVKGMQASWDKFLQRYEHSMLSSGMGAAVVTTWCMAHGQSPSEAALITVVSIITALVLNELLFNDNQHST